MAFVTYLHFQGNCAEAMSFYKDVFGGTDLYMMRYSEAPEDMVPDGASAAEANGVLHASLTAPGGTLMASDFPPGMPGEAQKAVSVSWSEDGVPAAKAIYDRLSEGGEVIMPFGETFWAEGFGMLRDRFGTHWMVSGPGKM